MSLLRQTTGIAFAAKDKDMRSGFWQYDSRKKKWTVDTKADPKHVNVFDMTGGTKFVLPRVPASETEEVLFRMEHKMPFPPQFLVFFYVRDAPAGFSQMIGNYTFNVAPMLFNRIDLGEEKLYAQVDSKYFYIKHHAKTFSLAGAGNTTFLGSDYKFRVRFELLNQEAFFFGSS